MTNRQILRTIFTHFTEEQKTNVRRHLDNGVPVLAGRQARLFSSEEGGL